MIKEENTAIITYCDEFCAENIDKDFMNSLFEKAAYKGEVVLLNYGIDETDVKALLQKYPIKVLNCKKIMPVFSNRYYDIPHAIDMLSDAVTHVMTIDGGDVWFQTSISQIFEECKDGVGCVEEERIIGQDDFTEHCMKFLTPEERQNMDEKLVGKKVKNSGMICGPRELMRNVIVNVQKDMQKVSSEYFGIDQLCFNVEWYALPEANRVMLDDLYNYVLVTNEGHFTIKDDLIYDEKGRMVSVVHNAGANWRILKRPFENKKVNEDQYVEIRKSIMV